MAASCLFAHPETVMRLYKYGGFLFVNLPREILWNWPFGKSLGHGMSCHAISCHVMTCHALLQLVIHAAPSMARPGMQAMACHAPAWPGVPDMPWFIMPWHVMLCHGMPRHAMPWHAIACGSIAIAGIASLPHHGRPGTTWHLVHWRPVLGRRHVTVWAKNITARQTRTGHICVYIYQNEDIHYM